ncbi:DUF1918 domain-containing protein [Pseudonocardia parietis]|uniref:DUF1918 domain-containing protein n=1 Tax=Pseudonocardia parietis TaxID=570936 RepID=A0ABS4VX49_9PSEU|nr:DUF1918 domain-containing protein [Pseudonocardia parietis]MBP2368492.1 hypothetical protein [Pseudonocardia parietis]
MQAAVGDRIIIESATLGRSARFGEVLAVLGEQEGPPYRIRWDDGTESLYCPGPDARVRTISSAVESV